MLYIPIDFSKCPNAFASKEAFTTPFPPGTIGSLVQSATAQAQEVVTLVSTNGWFPVLVMVYSTVTGRFHSICPKLCVSLFEEIRGWATAAKATVSKDNIDSKLRFMRYFLFWCTNVGVLDEFFTTDYTD